MVDNYNANRITGVWLMIVIIIVTLPSLVFARATNVNEVNTLFEDHIENKAEYFRNLEGLRDESTGRIESKSGMSSIKEIDKVDGFSSQINSIDAYDLGAEGKKVRASEEYRFYDEHEMAPDWSKSGNRMHKEDAEDITSAVARKLKALTKHLEELGLDFDCSRQRKPVQLDPSFSLEIKRNPKENVEFDQIFCEEARNKYNCKDKVSLTCRRRGKGYGEWEPRTIRFNGHVLHNTKMDWGYAIKWKYKRWGWHITPNHPSYKAFSGPEAQVDSKWRTNPAAIIADARAYIASHHGVSIEQIGEYVQFPASGRGIGNIGGVGCRWRVVWDEYEFGYSYRDAYDICEEWEEDWDERCNLK